MKQYTVNHVKHASLAAFEQSRLHRGDPKGFLSRLVPLLARYLCPTWHGLANKTFRVLT